MSSGFVSAGTNEEPVERDAEWLRVQQELEEERRRKAEVGKQTDGKSLYDVLQQNKLAKQEQFEEKTRLRNQFRSLDEDEVEFLDSVLESTRAQEAAVKRDTADQLEEFRRQREEAEKLQLGPTSSDVTPAEQEEWTIPARKRRREKKGSLLQGKKQKTTATQDKKNANDRKVEAVEPDENKGISAEDCGVKVAGTIAGAPANDKDMPPSKPTEEEEQTRKGHLSRPVKPPSAGGLVSYDSNSDSE